ncbi:MAG: cupin domain-containing protein [Alphaproteobacteria bacterium]|nr:cupin domain-containing protein [Alphaproteobacteria bacterium]
MTAHLNISNWTDEVSKALPDKEVGISLAFLAGNDQFASYAVELNPGAHVAAHYHPEGIEIYQIVTGLGLMKTGVVQTNNTIMWHEPVDVQIGDFFTIHPGAVHRLENNSSERLILIATCSPSNLRHNRVVIK